MEYAPVLPETQKPVQPKYDAPKPATQHAAPKGADIFQKSSIPAPKYEHFRGSVDGLVTASEIKQFTNIVDEANKLYNSAMEKNGKLSPEETKTLKGLFNEANKGLLTFNEDIRKLMPKDKNSAKETLEQGFIDKRLYGGAFSNRTDSGLGRLRDKGMENAVNKLASLETKLEGNPAFSKEIEASGKLLDRIGIAMVGESEHRTREGQGGRGEAIGRDAEPFEHAAAELNTAGDLHVQKKAAERAEKAGAEKIREQKEESIRSKEFDIEFMGALAKDMVTNESMIEAGKTLIAALGKASPEIKQKIMNEINAAENQPVWKTALNVLEGEEKVYAKAAIWLFNEAKFAKEHPGEATWNVVKGVTMESMYEPIVNKYIALKDDYLFHPEKYANKAPDFKPIFVEIKVAAAVTAVTIATAGTADVGEIATSVRGVVAKTGRFTTEGLESLAERFGGKTAAEEGAGVAEKTAARGAEEISGEKTAETAALAQKPKPHVQKIGKWERAIETNQSASFQNEAVKVHIEKNMAENPTGKTKYLVMHIDKSALKVTTSAGGQLTKEGANTGDAVLLAYRKEFPAMLDKNLEREGLANFGALYGSDEGKYVVHLANPGDEAKFVRAVENTKKEFADAILNPETNLAPETRSFLESKRVNMKTFGNDVRGLKDYAISVDGVSTKYAVTEVDHVAIRKGGEDALEKSVDNMTGTTVGKADRATKEVGAGVKKYDEGAIAVREASVTKEQMFSEKGIGLKDLERPNYKKQLEKAGMSLDDILKDGVAVSRVEFGLKITDPEMEKAFIERAVEGSGKELAKIEAGRAAPIAMANLEDHTLGDIVVRSYESAAENVEKKLAEMGVKDVNVFTPRYDQFEIHIGKEAAAKGITSEQVTAMLKGELESMTKGLEFKPMESVIPNAKGMTVSEANSQLAKQFYAKQFEDVGLSGLSDEQAGTFLRKSTKYASQLSNPELAVPKEALGDYRELGIPLIEKDGQIFVDTAKVSNVKVYGARDLTSATRMIEQYSSKSAAEILKILAPGAGTVGPGIAIGTGASAAIGKAESKQAQ